MNREMASETPRGTSEQPRTRKRARYTQVACNECKRRKLKCSGEVICARCARDNVPCAYPANYNLSNRPFDARESQDEPLDARFCAVDRKLETLQQEMQAMAARLREMEATTTTTTTSHQETTKTSGLPRSSSAYTPASGAGTTSGSTSAALSRILNPPKSPTYVGPTSAEFGLGIQENEYSDEGNGASPSPSDTVLIAGDLLGGIGLDEALRLVSVYEASVGIVYPCVDLDSVRAYITDFFHTGGHAAAHSTDDDWFFARDVSVVKTILATALLAESHGRSERAAQLEDSVEDEFAGRLKIAEVDMKELLILALLSIFHSYRDDEVIAWRHIGLAVRGCMQLGLHRQETWLRTGGVFPGALQCRWASRLFWCIYVLDRKWSFGTGLPFAIQDSDMDTNLPEPGAATPYLTCMITYARLSTKIWGLVLGWPSRSRATRSDHCSYLDFQVQQWIQSVPQELRFDPSRLQSPEPDSHHHHHHHHHQSDSMVMLQVLLALQANQLRILVYRQNLLSAESIERDVPGSSIAVETAKSTVHMLGFFSRVSDLYLQRPEPFNYFLLSALAALFLAVLHAPSRFSQVCRPEFYSAVDMVRRSSTRARTSRRLQKVIRSLKLIPVTQDHQRGKNAAAASAGAGGGHAMGHTLDSHGGPISKPTMTTSTPISSPRHHLPAPSISARQLPAPGWSGSAPVAFPTEANNGCEDLTSFFELAGGLYFDDPHIETAGLLADGLDVFQAEDEALTRVMAGLL